VRRIILILSVTAVVAAMMIASAPVVLAKNSGNQSTSGGPPVTSGQTGTDTCLFCKGSEVTHTDSACAAHFNGNADRETGFGGTGGGC